MLERICATCRALASETRLHMLYALCSEGELASKNIARLAGVTRPEASVHLARLSNVGLVWRRRSGAYVYCCVPPDTAPGFGPAVSRNVRRVCREPGPTARGWPSGDPIHLSERTVKRFGRRVARALDVVFDAATGLGNVRRLLVLRLLLQKGPLTLGDVRREVQMSPQACDRHIEKLHGRGYVREAGDGGWALARQGRTPFHEALFRLASDAMVGSSRSYITPG